MKLKPVVKIIVAGICLAAGMLIYWYCNPSVDDEDFHLHYILSDKNVDFYKERNTAIGEEKYTYNNQIYGNDREGYRLIIHSIDFNAAGEKILIMTDYLSEEKRVANLTYKNQRGVYAPIDIKTKDDSIYVYQKTGFSQTKAKLLFKGRRIKDGKRR